MTKLLFYKRQNELQIHKKKQMDLSTLRMNYVNIFFTYSPCKEKKAVRDQAKYSFNELSNGDI